MVTPLTRFAEHKNKKFQPDICVAFVFAGNRYHALFKRGKDPNIAVQSYNDLHTKQDILEFTDVCQSVDIIEGKKNRKVILLVDVDWKTFEKARKDLTALMKNPKQNVFVIYLFACHGVQQEGK